MVQNAAPRFEAGGRVIGALSGPRAQRGIAPASQPDSDSARDSTQRATDGERTPESLNQVCNRAGIPVRPWSSTSRIRFLFATISSRRGEQPRAQAWFY